MAKSTEMVQSANMSPTKGFAAWQALTKALFDDYRPELRPICVAQGPNGARSTIGP